MKELRKIWSQLFDSSEDSARRCPVCYRKGRLFHEVQSKQMPEKESELWYCVKCNRFFDLDGMHVKGNVKGIEYLAERYESKEGFN